MHGLAVNVSADLANFQRIIPCGITHPDRGVCTVQQLNPTASIEQVSQLLVKSFADIFDLEFEHSNFIELEKEMTRTNPELATAVLNNPL
jgi:lipoate-protein ligase B